MVSPHHLFSWLQSSVASVHTVPAYAVIVEPHFRNISVPFGLLGLERVVFCLGSFCIGARCLVYGFDGF